MNPALFLLLRSTDTIILDLRKPGPKTAKSATLFSPCVRQARRKSGDLYLPSQRHRYMYMGAVRHIAFYA